MQATQNASYGLLERHLSENPNRRQKWSYLLEGVDQSSPKEFHQITGVDRGYKRRIMERLCEQIERHAAFEGDPVRSWMLEDTLSTAVGAFTTFAFPLVRRVYPKLLAPELFIVQPMTQPTGKIFFLDFLYGQTSQGATAGTRIDVQANFSKLYTQASEGGTVNDLNMSITSITVTAEERKVKAIWSIEAQQDLAAYHGLDLETENMQVSADEITREIDRYLISNCLSGATAGNVNYNINGSPSILPTEQQQWNEWLYNSIIDANNLIFTKRYRNANWIVTDPTTAGRLEKLQGFKLADLSDSQLQVQMGGRHLYGTLQNRWLIYKDPWFSANTMLLGYKGTSFVDAGFVYAPFVPFWTTPLFIDPNDMKPRRGILSRFGQQMVIGDLFATVSLTSS